MIDHINGTIKAVHDQALTVALGPIGFLVEVPNAQQFQTNASIELHTYLHWNQEQGPRLFGFTDALEKQVFLLIVGCSGLGPKIGLAALGALGAEQFLSAIQEGNERALSKVSGIGPKKAEQIIIQLRSKVEKLIKSGVSLSGATSLQNWQQVSDVLQSLNYSRNEISAAMKYLGDHHTGPSVPFDQLIRHALSFLAKKV